MDDEAQMIPATLKLTAEQEQEVMQLAAVGLMPREIAVALELEVAAAMEFCRRAALPGDHLNRLMLSGRANGKATPQIKLQEQAAAGNIDAIKLLQQIQDENRFNELLASIDDDEYGP